MIPHIRKAVKTDCPRLLELIKELAAHEKAPDSVTVDLSHFKESGFGKHPVWWAFVVEVEDIIVGFALYYIRYSTWQGKRMYLEDIIVTESKRGNGLGKMLFNHLIMEAQKLRLNGIAWQVLEWNTPAIEFYKKYQTAFDAGWINCSYEIDKQ